MEDVLEVYCRPYDEQEPVVCLDEMGKNLVKEKHPSEPAKPGQDRGEDYTSEACLYDTFPSAKAKQLLDRLEIHYLQARKWPFSVILTKRYDVPYN
jgi:hypothetical protein